VIFLRWKEVREEYPNQWAKMKILESSITENKRTINDMKVIKTIKNEKMAGRELGLCKSDEIVYHTSNEEIYLEIKDMFGFKMVL